MAEADPINRTDAPNEPKSLIISKDDLETNYGNQTPVISKDCLEANNGDQKPDICIALLGKTGYGKSTTGNTLLGGNLFRSSNESTSQTENVKAFTRKYTNERKVTWMKVVDTPGLMDTKFTDNIIYEIAKMITLQPDGYDAFLIVVRYATRWTKEEQECVKQLEHLFGPQFYDYCIVIFTYGDNFQGEQDDKPANSRESFDEYISNEKLNEAEGSMQYLLTKVRQRAVLFDNRNAKKDETKRVEMMDKLLNFISSVSDANMEKKRTCKYDNIIFQKARDIRRTGPSETAILDRLVEFIRSWYNLVMIVERNEERGEKTDGDDTNNTCPNVYF